MNSLRRWLYRPKRSDPSLLAQFYFADEELNLIAAELDGFEGRKDPERCAALVNQLRACQARVLNIVSQMMDESIKDQRALRDFRVKFPDDVIQENLAGQLWFGAECLAAGSSIMNREVESACMRPLARALTKNLDSLRTILREQCLRNVDDYSDVIRENLIIFDKLFAEFELSYVSAMVSVKTAHEYDMIQEITVLFSETVQRALGVGLLTQEMIDEYDPALMFTIPRLAIICGVLVFKDGPLNPDNDPWNISEMFRPFQTLLLKIRELLGILTADELTTLERALCSQEEPSFLLSLEEKKKQAREEKRKHRKERKGSVKVKNNKPPSDGDNGSVESELTAMEIAERLEALALNFEASHHANGNIKGASDSSSIDPSIGDGKNEVVVCSSSPQNSGIVPGDDNESTNVPDLVSDLGCVEDLYHEANLDSSDMFSAPTSAFPGHDLLIQGIHMHPQFTSDNEDGDNLHADSHSLSSLTNPIIHNEEEGSFLPNGISDSHHEALNDRDRFSLNKCDSKDSGLQSEVVSNSGSMFTISSSDSNQQILSSDSIPTPSDHNCTDSSEEAESHDLTTDGISHTHLENSTDSSATVTSALTTENGCIEDDHDLAPANAMQCRQSSSNAYDRQYSEGCDRKEGCDLVNIRKDGDGCLPRNDEKCGEVVINQNSDPYIRNGLPELVKDIDAVVVGSADTLDLDTNCDNANVKSAQTCSGEMPNSSCETTHDQHNHSHDTPPVSIPESGHSQKMDVCGDSDRLPSDTLQMNGNSISAEDSVSDVCVGGVNVVTHKEKLMMDCDSSKCSPTVDQLPVHNSQQQGLMSSLSLSTSTLVSGEDLPTGPNLTNVFSSVDTDSVKAESHCSSSTLVQETPQPFEASLNSGGDSNGSESALAGGIVANSSDSTLGGGDVPNSHDSALVNGEKADSDNRKGASISKAKSNSKKRGKRLEKKVRRQEPGSHRSRDTKSVLCPHHAKMILEAHQQLDAECYNSSDTSSYNSDCGDKEEIALAIEAAESATRNHVRARFRSSSDMIHRLFVCISGVADQLQTNFAGDLRNILRCVFDMNCPEPMDTCESDKPKDTTPLGAAYRSMSHASRAPRRRHSSLRRDPPAWLPDEQSDDCMACQVPFNFLRRRHHCRNCGKLFCSRCSSNFVPLPHFGQEKAVRVCNRCFMFQVTPFTSE